MFRTLLFIGIGSFIGGICRYLSQQFIQANFPSSIPLGTLFVNIAGCFFIGVIYALSEKGNILSPDLRIFLVTGFCGGFTTYSAFAFENVSMMLDGKFYYAAAYILLSIIIGFGAVYAGSFLIKLIS